ncbi:MAG: PadR family transcriptional regulator [bacterium]|nr:PadR family transcriptional regulator [bacterium]
MNILTRTEELILLSIWRLQDKAYCVPIHEQIVKFTGEKILLGSIYMPLDRLVKRGLIESYLSQSTPERGGRPKRIYSLSRVGKEALNRVRELQSQVWDGIPKFSLDTE